MRYLIVGNGAAGVTAAQTIREKDPHGEITIVGAEPYPMYSRPGLAYLLNGTVSEKQILSRSLSWYAHHNLRLLTCRVNTLDTFRQRILLDDGQWLPYDRLLLATGARATPAPYPGGELDGVVFLDTLDGTRQILRKIRRHQKAVVIGGGITALELCEGLARQGVETHYFVRKSRLWDRVFNDKEAQILENRMHHHGVQIHYQTEIAEILGDRRGRVRGVRLQDGREFACHLVGVGIGVQPVIDYLDQTEIARDRGILVNEYLETSAPAVYAAGDCAQTIDRCTGRHLLDILWPSAVAEGHTAGLNMVGWRRPLVKGTPFNACLLFGLHVTIIGQIDVRVDDQGDPEVIQHHSRGSSESWFILPHNARSAWYGQDENTIRLVMDGTGLIGALVMGQQTLTDPLRYLIEKEIDISPIQAALRRGGEAMRNGLGQFWMQIAHQYAPPALNV